MSQRYEIREEIGKGGLGAVYKAFDTQLHREVAMKRVLTTEHASEEEVQAAGQKLIVEAKTLSSLNHPNIVTVFDVGFDEKGGFVVMELLNGETLDETVARGVLTQNDFIEIVYQTMEALIAAQASDVLHRDLKPTNVMVIWQPSGKFQTKILDFGLAKFSKSPSVQTMDQEDAVMGSIYFMAPEQFERTELDYRSDLYQIGCVYYHALTSQYPFHGETAPQVMNAHLQHRVTPLDKLRPDLSPSICQWVMWLINRKMDNRPANATDALERFPRNPEPPNAEPVLQAIPVEETPAGATTGVQVVVPSHGAEPPAPGIVTANTRTGSAPVLRTGSAPVSPQTHTGSAPIRGAHGTVGRTGPVEAPGEKSRKPLFITLAIVSALTLGLIGWVVSKNAKTRAAHTRLVELAGAEAPAGGADDIALALQFLGSKDAGREEKSMAVGVLSKVGGTGVDAAIVSALESSSSPYLRLKLSQAAADRGLSHAVPAMMKAFQSAASDSQKSDILGAVRNLATRENLPALLDALGGKHSIQVRTLFEGIVTAVYRRQPRDAKLTGELLSRVSTTTEDERRSLFRILGALGTDDVKTRLRSIFSGEDKAARYDAMAAFMSWPDRSALPPLEEILTGTDDNALKIATGRAYARLASLPAAVPLTEKIETWRKGVEYVTRPQDLRRLFAAMTEAPSPEVKALLKEAEGNPALAPLARQATAQIDKIMATAPEVAPDELLAASKALISGDNLQGAFFNADAGAIVLWRSPDTWFIWHFKVKQAGNYGFSINQSYPLEGVSEFEVIVGDTSFPGKSTKTASGTEFTYVELDGTAALEPGKVYTLTLHGRGITQPRMMDVSGVKVEKR